MASVSQTAPWLTRGLDHPSQEELTDLLQNTTTNEECQAMLAQLRKQGRDALDRVFESVDVLVALADSVVCSYASAAGKTRHLLQL